MNIMDWEWVLGGGGGIQGGCDVGQHISIHDGMGWVIAIHDQSFRQGKETKAKHSRCVRKYRGQRNARAGPGLQGHEDPVK